MKYAFPNSPPPAPTANVASNVTTIGFTANWCAANWATGYRLDVSTNSAFSNYLAGYQDLDVGNVLSRSVSGLTPGNALLLPRAGLRQHWHQWQLKHGPGGHAHPVLHARRLAQRQFRGADQCKRDRRELDRLHATADSNNDCV